MNKLISCGLPNRLLAAALLAASVALTACGGGGGDDGSKQDSSTVVPKTPTVSAGTPSAASTPSGASAPSAASTPSAATPASGTNASGGSQSPVNNGGNTAGNTDTNITPPPAVVVNSVPITVDNTLDPTIVNTPYVSVQLCAPGTQGASQCVTLDHMLLDTGSVGVRVMSSALGAALAVKLPPVTGASNDTTGTAPLAECAIFASGYTWGSMRRADVVMGGEAASNLPIQLVGDSGYSATPSDCVRHGAYSMTTVELLGANGIVGIGHLARDFPEAAQKALAATYYFCPTPSSCTAAIVPLNMQTANPVAAFKTDNNGTIIHLPALPATGQASVTGQLIFGIGTRDNNTLPASATRVAVTDRGLFTTTYAGRTMSSVVDSGSNGLFFQDATLPVLASWFAPATTQVLSSSMISSTGNAQSTVSFSIANSSSLFALGYAAHDNLGAPLNSMFMWGLPFFYGRSVYTALSSAQTKPYVAF
ncbi:DUF3443 domain-containing protein [Paraburkholderia azotifigens]|uniref:DUF3443 domain-containing protein n=1 Tax=Paraburkholderia azotifigens TaxID=2057004 RepID=A0ABU9QZF7_9BURK